MLKLPKSAAASFALRTLTTAFRYSSEEQLLTKLRYAITNCKAIDSDAYARTTLPEDPETNI